MKRIIRRPLGNSATCALTILLASVPFAALAAPWGGVVSQGAATIGSAGNVLTINQSSSRAIINWGSFNIAQGETTLFLFNGPAGAHSAVLNRVNVGNPSTIAGMLQSRVGADGPVGGTVLILNPSGILFTPTSQINVGSLIASTLNLADDSQFLNNSTLRLSGSSTAGIQNQGNLNALGDVFLIAHTVQNAGTITAGGVAGLAAGTTVSLAQSGNERLTVEAGSGIGTPIGVENTAAGQINAVSAELKAAGGNIYALAINNGGAIRANTVAREGGRIVLRSDGGKVLNQGTLEARGTGLGARGGEVQVTGGDVHLGSGSRIDVSGVAGGGTALIGGDYQGRNPAVPNSQRTTVDAGSVIRADAGMSGDGGKVVVWSDGITDFAGAISARGGAHGGNGGSLEVSGHQHLVFRGGVDASARGGRFGTLLLDPVGDLFIGTADPGDGSSFLDVAFLNAVGASISLTADHDVIFGAAVNMANNGVGFTARAGNDVVADNPLTTRGGAITLSANDNFNGTASGVGSVFVGAINTGAAAQANGSIILTVNGGTGVVRLGSGSDLATGGGLSGFITFNGPVVQSGSAHLTGSALNLGPSWDAANNDLRLTIAGPVTVPSVFANVRNFTSDGIGGTTVAGDFTTSGSQTYANAVVQTANAHLTGTALTLGSSWNAAGKDLQLTMAGAVTLPSVFANLNNFTCDGAGGTIINGTFTTLGSQTYSTAVSQSGNARIIGTTLALGSTWDAGLNDLRLSMSGPVTVSSQFANVRNFTSDGAGGTTLSGAFTTSGSQTYSGPVSQADNVHLTATALTLGPSWNAAGSDLQLTIAAPVAISSSLVNARNLTSDGAGGTTLSGNITTSGSQTYGNAVSQTANTHLTGTALNLGPSWDAAGNDLQLTIGGSVTVPAVFANVRNFTSDGVGGTIVGGNFTTSGSQTYGNNVAQSGNSHLTAAALTLGPSWNAAGNDLQLTIASPFTVSSALANVRDFTSDGAGGTTIAGNFTTSGSQTYGNAVSQSANAHLTATALSLGPSWNAAGNDLQLTIAGAVTVPSVFVNVRNFTSDGAGGTTLNGNFATSGSQTYANAVAQTGNSRVTATALNLGSTWNAAGNDLQLTIGGPVTVSSAFANVRNFTSDGAGGTILNGDFTTSGSQTYVNAVAQAANAHITASALTLGPSWNAAGNDLQLTIGGVVTVPAVFVNVRSFISDGAGGTTLNGNFTTSGGQTYGNAVSQSGNSHITATALNVGPSWNAAGNDLQLTIGSAVTVSSAFANVRNFTSDGAGGTTLNGDFTTSGSQTYGNAVSQSGNSHLTATALTLGPSWNAAGNDLQLTIASPFTVSSALANVRNFTSDGAGGTTLNGDFTTSGSQTYGNAVSQSANAHLTATALSLGPSWNAAGNDLQLTIAGAVTVPSVFVNVRNFTSDGAGGTTLNGNFATSGSQTYANAVAQTGNSRVTATALNLGSTWNAAGNDLQLTIGGPVTVSSAFANVRNFTSDGAGGTVLNGDFTTSGSQTYGNAVAQSGNSHLTATTLTLGPSWNAAGNDLQLTIGSAVTVPSVFANVRSFTSDGAGGTLLAGNFTTSGSQVYGSPVTLQQNLALAGTTVALNGNILGAGHDLTLNASSILGGTASGLGVLTVNGTTALNGSSVTTSGGQNYNGTVTLGANNTLSGPTVNFNGDLAGGGRDLVVNGATTVGASSANTASGLGALTINGATTVNAGSASAAAITVNGNSALNGSTIATSGVQNYNGAVTLGNDYTLSAGSGATRSIIGLNGTLAGGGHSLTANGDTTLGGAAGGLSTLAVNGNTRLAGGSVTTTGTQNYNGDATLAVDNTLSASTVSFAHGLDGGGKSLAVQGDTTVGSVAADTIRSLRELAVTGNATINGTFRDPGQPAGGTTTRFDIDGNLVVKSKMVNFNTANHIAHADQNSINGDWVRGTGIEAALNEGEASFFWFAPLGATNPGEDTFRRLLAAVLPRARRTDLQETKASAGTRPPIDFAGWNKGSSDVARATVATVEN